MIYGLKTKEFFVLIMSSSRDNLDAALYRGSNIKKLFAVRDKALRGYSHLVYRKIEHGSVVSCRRSRHLPGGAESQINQFLKEGGLSGNWYAMWLIDPHTEIETVLKKFSEKKIKCVGVEPFIYPPERLKMIERV